MTFYFLPYLLPTTFFIPIYIKINSIVVICCGIAIVFFCAWLRINLKVIKVSLSDEIIAIAPRESKYTYILRIYNTLGSSICEEIYFRSFLIQSLNETPIAMRIVVSVLCFMLSHYILPWGKNFTRKDYINQAIFGAVNAILFIISDSIVPCILLHLLANSPTVAETVRCYGRHYLRKAHFDDLLIQNNSYDELEM